MKKARSCRSMEKITKADSRKIPSKILWLGLFVFAFQFSAWAYNDQIAVETPNAVKTVYDIRVHAFLRHLYDEKKIVDTNSKAWLQNSFENERTNYIGQFMVQRYVAEDNLGLKSTPDEIARAAQKIKQAFSTNEEREKAFLSLNITEADVQQWVANRLILEKFRSTMIQDRVIL